MSRRRRAEKREVLPDPKFGDLIVTKFMNGIMYEGKKAVAETIVYGAMDILEAKRRDQTPLETFHAAEDVVADARKVLHPAAADQHHRVLLQIVAFARDVAHRLDLRGQAHLGDLTQGRVRLLGGHGIDAGADAPALR